MKRQWLYNKATSEGKLFEGEGSIDDALDSGDWEDTPAKCGGEHSSTGPGIGLEAIEDYKGLTADEFKEKFTVKELRSICKELGIKLARNSTEDEIADTLVEALTKQPE